MSVHIFIYCMCVYLKESRCPIEQLELKLNPIRPEAHQAGRSHHLHQGSLPITESQAWGFGFRV